MKGKLVVDSVHGDIHLSELEWRIVDTPEFQRLRNLKQLQMGHLTYPNATHTRFAHSLGVFAVMSRVLETLDGAGLNDDDVRRLRLAALLHDIGHYPYSHLMEKVDRVVITEEFVEGGIKTLNAGAEAYPDHEEVGSIIVSCREGISELVGGSAEAQKISNLFRRTDEADAQLSKLIHSSLDMDRLDYLIRDSKATGAPYGGIDLDYLLNNVTISPGGLIGVSEKAMPAAEHFLLARLYMHRCVYWHKTTFGFEEACKQLLHRVRRDPERAESYGLAVDGVEIRTLVASDKLGTFTDAYVDRVIHAATADAEPVIAALANCIAGRRAPKLVKEVSTFSAETVTAGTQFKQACRFRLATLAERYCIPLGQFLFAESKPLTLEERAALMTAEEADKRDPAEREELIKVFRRGVAEPVSLVEIPESPIAQLARNRFMLRRLYVVCADDAQARVIDDICKEVADWDAT